MGWDTRAETENTKHENAHRAGSGRVWAMERRSVLCGTRSDTHSECNMGDRSLILPDALMAVVFCSIMQINLVTR